MPAPIPADRGPPTEAVPALLASPIGRISSESTATTTPQHGAAPGLGWVQVRGLDQRVVLARILMVGWRTPSRLDDLVRAIKAFFGL